MKFSLLAVIALATALLCSPDANARFLQTDPVGYKDDVDLYTYVRDDPVDHTDTTGQACDPDLGCDSATQKALQDTADRVGTLAAEHPGETQQVVGAGLAAIPTPLSEGAGETLEGTGTLTRALDGEDAAAGGISKEATASASTRAQQIQGTLSARTQRSVTTAVTETKEGPRIVTSSEGALRPAQRAALGPGEVAGKGVQGVHAEINGVNAARQAGLTPTSVAPSRPPCPECARTMQQQGIKLDSQ
jgi:hypothetical protein